MDHANGLATFAAEGLRAQAHFVEKVMKGDDVVYGEKLPAPDQPRVFSQQNSNDLTYALSQVTAAKTSIGWDTAGKTGTWEYARTAARTRDAWMVGFDKKLAAAVWVGNKAEEHPLRDKTNQIIYGAGVPASIWKKFMTRRHDRAEREEGQHEVQRAELRRRHEPAGFGAGAGRQQVQVPVPVRRPATGPVRAGPAARSGRYYGQRSGGRPTVSVTSGAAVHRRCRPAGPARPTPHGPSGAA